MPPRLERVPTESVHQDPDNPRLVFPPEELERLASSIASEGVLVPVVIHAEEDGYRLIDGDRRWQCARQLGLPEIPAIIVDKPDSLAKLVQMFNIHQIREQWQDMPMAWALGKLIEKTGVLESEELSRMTGLSVDRLKRLRHALDLPQEYQKMIYQGEIPLNFFWELKANIIDPISKRRPDLFQRYDAESILKVFVEKRLRSIITDTVSLRKVRPIVNFSADDLEARGESDLDGTLFDLFENPDTTIEDAYEDTVMVMVEAGKLERRSEAIIKGFRRLFEHASSIEERERVGRIAKGLVEALNELIVA